MEGEDLSGASQVVEGARGDLDGKAGEGTNSTYCHSRKETVDALTDMLGGARTGVIHVFSSSGHCSRTMPDAQWVDEPASDRRWLIFRG